ncbi:MAG: glycosyltransferase [Actinomycetia bacterium]|nr:glycosyltransferase [Actinomycetes bacterium]
MTKKKIAIYYPWIYLKGGAERLVLNIATRSRHDWTIFTNHYDRENTFPEFRDLNPTELSRVSVSRKYANVGNAALTIMTQKVDLSSFDLLVIMSEGAGDYFVLRNHDLPVICLCLTPLKVIHDPYSKQRYLEENRSAFLKYTISSSIFNAFDRMAWKHYKKIICISNEVKNRVLKAGLATEDKITVLYPGVDFENINPIAKFYKYFLIPGRIMWQKNLELGIEAFKKFQEIGGDKKFKLVIAGMVDDKSVPYYRKLRDLAKDYKNIEFVENPTDNQLFDLYRKCYSVIFTSLNEDWGIVPLEAMAFGKPVISVNKGGPRESIVDGETGFLVEPNVNSFVEKMMKLSRDLNLTKQLGEKGIKHVTLFSLSKFINSLDEELF